VLEHATGIQCFVDLYEPRDGISLCTVGLYERMRSSIELLALPGLLAGATRQLTRGRRRPPVPRRRVALPHEAGKLLVLRIGRSTGHLPHRLSQLHPGGECLHADLLA
jgi:hypothetical protein